MLNLKDSKEFTQLVKTLNQLEDEGEITHNSRGEYATFEKLNLAKGIIDVKDGGYAFVDTDLGGIFIKSDNINGAITYDEVLVEYYLDNLGRYEGKVDKIIKRNTRVIIGPVSRLRQKAIVRSIDSKIKLLVFIKEKDLRIGDTVVIQKAGDVIPEVVEVKKEKRTGKEIEFKMPDRCPVCGAEAVREEGEAVKRCIGIECSAKALRSIVHFASKEGMEIEGLRI